MRRPGRVFAGADRRDHARGRGRRRTCARLIYERFDCRWAPGLGKVKGRMFRIGPPRRQQRPDADGHALPACEMGLKLAGVKLAGRGVQAAMDHFASHPAACRSAARPDRPACNSSPFHARIPISQTPGDKPCNAEHSCTGRRRHTGRAHALRAQTLPSGPVRIVVGFPPGGGTDVLARVLAPEAARRCGTPR